MALCGARVNEREDVDRSQGVRGARGARGGGWRGENPEMVLRRGMMISEIVNVLFHMQLALMPCAKYT